MKRLFYIGLVLFSANILNAQSLKPWKINLPTGKQLKVNTTMAGKINQQMMGQNIDIDMKSDISDSVFIKSETAGSFNLSRTTVALKMHMSLMGKDIDFDSDKKEDNDSEVGQKLGGKIGVPVEATVSEKGMIKVNTITENESETNPMMALMPGNNDSASIAAIFLMPPSKNIKLGEKWKDSVISTNMTVENTYTFEKLENKIATLTYTSVTDQSGTTTINGMEVTIKMKMETTGTLKVNTLNGLVLERKSNIKTSGTNSMMGMEIPLTGDSESAITVIEY